jgi:endonuclease YncB( thermonuclease family)
MIWSEAKNKFLNFFNAIFLSVFFISVFQVLTSETASSQSKIFRVKSHLQFSEKFSGKTFVIDGDSLKVAGKEVRLFGIDAPEYKQTCFDAKKKQYACGQVSHRFLINLAGGKEVTCFHAGKEKYGRYLAKCYVGKVSINEELIKNGMAVIYSFSDPDEKMERLEAQAKKQRLGIWQGAFQLPRDYRKEHPRN